MHEIEVPYGLNWYLEQSPTNISIGELKSMSKNDRLDWSKKFRREVVHAWDQLGIPVTGGQPIDALVADLKRAAEFDVSRRTMECCVTLGYLAVDTRSNAGEAAQWLKENDFTSVRLVTTDWHMARTVSEFSSALPEGTVIEKDAVVSSPELATLFLEYNKLIAAAVSQGLPV